MKIRKSGESLLQAMKSVADKDSGVLSTFIALDVAGNVMIESFSKLREYDDGKVSVSAGGKNVTVYGSRLKIISCTKQSIQLCGRVEKIEISEVV